MKKTKTILIVLSSILIIFIISLTGLLIFLSNHSPKTNDVLPSQEAGSDRNPENTFTDVKRPVIYKGYEFLIPLDYSCMITEDLGPIIYRSGVFQLRLRVEDKNYESYTKDPARAMQKVKDAGGQITQEVSETQINGHTIAWFRTDLLGDDMVVLWSAADETRMFVGQLAILSQDMEEEDFLTVFAQIIETAKESDMPNSTEEDLLAWEPEINLGKRRPQGTIETDALCLTFPVPEDYYAQSDEIYISARQDYYADSYMTNDYVSVSCRVTKNDYESAEEEIVNDWNYEDAKIKTLEIAGYTYYYAESQKNNDGKQFQYVLAICELPESGWFYAVEAVAIDNERAIGISDIEGFLSIEVLPVESSPMTSSQPLKEEHPVMSEESISHIADALTDETVENRQKYALQIAEHLYLSSLPVSDIVKAEIVEQDDRFGESQIQVTDSQDRTYVVVVTDKYYLVGIKADSKDGEWVFIVTRD